MSFTFIGLIASGVLLLINWFLGFTHRPTAEHVTGWNPWLWRIFWVFLLVILVQDFLTNQHILFEALTLIIAAILSNLSQWKPKTK